MTTNLLHRHTAVTPPMAVAGDGCYIIDSNGKRYLDACGGAAVSALGHSNEAVLDAARDQLGKLAFAHTGFFTSEPAEKLGAKLVSLAPDGISHVYFVSGGSEAVETAIKLARQFQIEHGKPTKSKIIARWQGYHGNTLGALAAGGNRWRREPFAPLLSDAFQHIDPCYYWRHGNNDETPFAYGQRMANQLETAIVEAGPDNVAAFMAETVVGATLGAVPAVEGYFKRIREICDQYDVLLILDEVMCGMGRTGYLFASEAEGISPDIVCIAKALGAGIQPVGATLCTQDIYDAIAGG
ncbi:MAG: aspartate aminotransferase family protein, partial [Pseudomonadota bacterium]